MSMPGPNWIEANQHDLMEAVGEVRTALDRAIKGKAFDAIDNQVAEPASPSHSVLQTLCSAFGLSRFERAVLLMCAGVELDGRFSSLCGAAQGDPAKAFPTFSLARIRCVSTRLLPSTSPQAQRNWRRSFAFGREK